MGGGTSDQVAPHRAQVDELLQTPSRLSAREAEFLRSIRGLRDLSEAQERWLSNIVDPINFEKINSAALAVLPALVRRWLPDGRLAGKEWVARNPTRNDASAGSFSINVGNGKWGDFSSGDRGGDVISLSAYLHHGGDQYAAARSIRRMLGQ